MPDPRIIYNDLVACVRDDIPGFEVRFKRGDRAQELVGLLIRPFVRGYVERYTTTLYPRVYFPAPSDVERHPSVAWKTLAHEYVHLWDARREGTLFGARYLMPQLLAGLSLGAIATPWAPVAMVNLGWLAALGPWPAPWRTRTELRGYAMDLAIRWWTTGRRPAVDGLVRTFTGWSYYRMCASQSAARRLLEETVDRLVATDLPFAGQNTPFERVRDVLARHDMLRSPGDA